MHSSEPLQRKQLGQHLKQALSNEIQFNNHQSSNYLLQNKYYITSKLGNGSFGKLFKAIDVQSMENVAIKIHSLEQIKILKHEYEIMNLLYNQENNLFPKPFLISATNEFSYLVMQFLGPNLQVSLSKTPQRKLSLQNVAVFAIQALDRLRLLHNCGIVHRDLKPENFLLSSTDRVNQGRLFLVDYGLAKNYTQNYHSVIIDQKENTLIGTARYSSIKAMQGSEIFPKDELQSLGYVIVYLFKGFLP